MTPAVTIGQGYPSTVNGLPAHYIWSQALKIGAKYTHPEKGYTVDASAANVKKIQKSFADQKANDVESPIVTDHKVLAKNTLGYLKDTRLKDGWLEVLMQVLGDDSLDTVRKNKISLGLKPKMKDSQGNVYEFGVEHCAATPIPLVNGQSELIAASRSTDGEKFYFLSRAAPNTPKGARMKADTKKRMMACLSASGVKNMSDGDDDDMMMSKLLDHHEAMQKDLSKAGPWMAQAADKMKNLSRENEELTARATSAEEQVLTLSRADDEKEPNGVLFERSLRIAAAADSLLDRGYDAAIVTEVKSLAGTKENLNTLMLSRADDAEDCALARVIDIMKRARPAPGRGEQAGQWNLSRENTQTGATVPGTVTKKSPYTNADVPVPVAN